MKTMHEFLQKFKEKLLSALKKDPDFPETIDGSRDILIFLFKKINNQEYADKPGTLKKNYVKKLTNRLGLFGDASIHDADPYISCYPELFSQAKSEGFIQEVLHDYKKQGCYFITVKGLFNLSEKNLIDNQLLSDLFSKINVFFYNELNFQDLGDIESKPISKDEKMIISFLLVHNAFANNPFNPSMSTQQNQQTMRFIREEMIPALAEIDYPISSYEIGAGKKNLTKVAQSTNLIRNYLVKFKPSAYFLNYETPSLLIDKLLDGLSPVEKRKYCDIINSLIIKYYQHGLTDERYTFPQDLEDVINNSS